MFLNAFFQWAAVFVFVMIPASASAQAAPPLKNASPDEVMAQVVALRDSFVNQIKAAGFQPSLPPPTIILDNPPSYGSYQHAKNVVHVAVWDALAPEQQAGFAGLFGQGQTGERAFDEIVHHWVFTHELGHWWQACQDKIGKGHYFEEYNASRIAAAYWRLKDANFMDMTANSSGAREHARSSACGSTKRKIFQRKLRQTRSHSRFHLVSVRPGF